MIRPQYSQSTHIALTDAVAFALPPASSWPNRTYVVKSKRRQSLVVVVNDCDELPDGTLTLTTDTNMSPMAAFYSDGRRWWLLDKLVVASGGGAATFAQEEPAGARPGRDFTTVNTFLQHWVLMNGLRLRAVDGSPLIGEYRYVAPDLTIGGIDVGTTDWLQMEGFTA